MVAANQAGSPIPIRMSRTDIAFSSATSLLRALRSRRIGSRARFAKVIKDAGISLEQ